MVSPRFGFLLALVLACSSLLPARTWYVAGAGDDSADGTSPSRAFRTLQIAADLVEPGDTVLIGAGTYVDANTSPDSSIVVLARSGRPDAWITWQAAPGERPVLRPTGWNGVLVTASYQIIDGLTIIGPNDSLALVDALADAKKETPVSHFNTNGIYINGRLRGPEEKPHHVIVRNCVVGKNSCGGIVAIEADYVTIEDCQVFENAWYARYASSGITTLNNWRHDDAPGYHIIIQRNRVWNNKSLVPWERTGKLSDGNGIILDVTNINDLAAANPNADATVTTNPPADPAVVPATPAPKPQRPEWKGRALVANNVSAFNGGSGIHTFRTKHVDIINNTTYWNGNVVNYQELFPNRSDDIVILNNIIVPRPGGKITSDNRNTGVRWDYNVYPIAQDVFKGAHNLVADPRFAVALPHPHNIDFRLAPDSPALNSGTDDLAQSKDVLGSPRPAGRGRDRGAYEQ